MTRVVGRGVEVDTIMYTAAISAACEKGGEWGQASALVGSVGQDGG